jgi:hypothetical protein
MLHYGVCLELATLECLLQRHGNLEVTNVRICGHKKNCNLRNKQRFVPYRALWIIPLPAGLL